MNTIVAEMPMVNAAGGSAGKNKGTEDEKQITFNEVLKGRKEHTPEKDKEQEYDAEDGAALFAGPEMPVAPYVPEALRTTESMSLDILLPEQKADSTAVAQMLLPVDGDIEAVRAAGTEGQKISISGHAGPAGKEENANASAIKGEMPIVTAENTQDGKLLTMAEAEQLSAVWQTTRQPEETEVSGSKEKRDNAEMNAAAVKSSALAGKAAENAPAAREVTAAPDPAHNEGIRAEYMDMLKTDIVRQVVSGKQQVEIQLHPENLGKLVIKASYEAGKAVISIVCSEAKTMQAMSQQAREIAGIMEARTGNETEVVVERPAEDYLQQQQEQNGRGQEREPDRQKRESRKGEFSESFDFLQQLRLGLA